MSHTPGPWRIAFRDGSGEHHVVANCDPQRPDGMTERTVAYGSGYRADSWPEPVTPQEAADLRLIAAAPDLLAALEAIATVHPEVVGPSTRAAIARAKGTIASDEKARRGA